MTEDVVTGVLRNKHGEKYNNVLVMVSAKDENDKQVDLLDQGQTRISIGANGDAPFEVSTLVKPNTNPTKYALTAEWWGYPGCPDNFAKPPIVEIPQIPPYGPRPSCSA